MSKCICAQGRSRAHSCLLLKKTVCRRHSDGSALRWLLGVLTGLCQGRISTLPFRIAPSLHPSSRFSNTSSSHPPTRIAVLRSVHEGSPWQPPSPTVALLVLRKRDRQQQVEPPQIHLKQLAVGSALVHALHRHSKQSCHQSVITNVQ